MARMVGSDSEDGPPDANTHVCKKARPHTHERMHAHTNTRTQHTCTHNVTHAHTASQPCGRGQPEDALVPQARIPASESQRLARSQADPWAACGRGIALLSASICHSTAKKKAAPSRSATSALAASKWQSPAKALHSWPFKSSPFLGA